MWFVEVGVESTVHFIVGLEEGEKEEVRRDRKVYGVRGGKRAQVVSYVDGLYVNVTSLQPYLVVPLSGIAEGEGRGGEPGGAGRRTNPHGHCRYRQNEVVLPGQRRRRCSSQRKLRGGRGRRTYLRWMRGGG